MVEVLLGAVLSLFISIVVLMATNYAQKNNELIGYYRNIFYKLYVPFYSDILFCYETENAFRGYHDITKPVHLDELSQKIEEFIENNLSSFDYNFIEDYINLKTSLIYDDFSGTMYFSQLDIMILFTKGFLNVAQKSKIRNKEIISKLKEINEYWQLINRIALLARDQSFGIWLFQLKWMFNFDPRRNIRKLNKYLEDIDGLKAMINDLFDDEQIKTILIKQIEDNKDI